MEKTRAEININPSAHVMYAKGWELMPFYLGSLGGYDIFLTER